MSLMEAEGFVGLGMWAEALRVLEGEDGAALEGLKLRLRCFAALGEWGPGVNCAERLTESGDAEGRRMAVEFYEGFAAVSAKRGWVEDERAARERVGEIEGRG